MRSIVVSLFVILLAFGCTPKEEAKELGIFEQHRLSGQIETAEQLKELMGKKKYEEAIRLFSSRQQTNIAKMKEDSAVYDIWCKAWTFDSGKLERYVTLIERDQAPFVYEDGKWKIDEK
ncbi:MAG: hypothetical protein JKX73_10170 [Flavobacteriales bacterium]|nr:hypothetical protein [Flavobacteriales bacterium]